MQLHLDTDDIFDDVGSGSGNVISQVELQTLVKKCVGLEIRADVAEKSQPVIHSWSQHYPRLSIVDVVCGDIKVDTSTIARCTIIFANNQVFTPETNHSLQMVICESTTIKTVIIADKFCYRCTVRCNKEFCQMWELQSTVNVEVCWTSNLLELYIYRRRNIR